MALEVRAARSGRFALHTLFSEFSLVDRLFMLLINTDKLQASPHNSPRQAISLHCWMAAGSLTLYVQKTIIFYSLANAT